MTKPQKLDEYPSKLAMQVTDIIFNRDEGWSLKLEQVLAQEIEKAEQRVREEEKNRLSPYADHTRDCILNSFEEGRPKEGGGYEQKLGGVWYETSPVDKTPKCDCGLDDFLSTPKD